MLTKGPPNVTYALPKKVRERLDVARKAETAKIEERKNSHIERLMKAHEKAFAEIKNYYNDITHNNLDLIRSLKEEVKFSSPQAFGVPSAQPR